MGGGGGMGKKKYGKTGNAIANATAREQGQ